MWNVKQYYYSNYPQTVVVLIETLWNVKKQEHLPGQGNQDRINRNIVECKDVPVRITRTVVTVLIETLWNVKGYKGIVFKCRINVLIETLWNVKLYALIVDDVNAFVLIETLRNVKSGSL